MGGKERRGKEVGKGGKEKKGKEKKKKERKGKREIVSLLSSSIFTLLLRSENPISISY